MGSWDPGFNRDQHLHGRDGDQFWNDLQLGNGVTDGNITGNVSDNGTLALDPDGPITLGGVISGSGNLMSLAAGR